MSNPVPDGWSVSPLGSLVDVRSSNVDKKTESSEIPVRLCNYTDVYYNNRITSIIEFMKASAKQREIDRFTLDEGDVIITKDSETANDIAVPAYVSEELSGVVCGYHLTLLKPNRQKCDGEFLAHMFQLPSVQHYFYILANGITRFGLTADAINGAPLLSPPLPEQQKIAAILSTVDDVIEKTRAQIDKLKDLKTGMMQELLTRGIRHTEFKDSPVGRIPVGWEVVEISSVMNFMTNGFVGSATSHYREAGVPYLMSKNVRNNRLDLRGLTYISHEFHEKSDRSRLEEGDLLTVQSGHIGTSAVVPKEFHGANCHALIVSKPKHEVINTHFLAYYLNSLDGRERLSQIFVGSTVPHINTSDLKKFLVPLPSLDEQVSIRKTLFSVDAVIDTIAEKLEYNQSLKKALMQDLLTGKVRVNVDKKEEVSA